MRGRIFLWLGAVITLSAVCQGATITWCNIHPEGPAPITYDGEPVPGKVTFGEPNLSNGALVQLWKAVGYIDDPNLQIPAYMDTSWKVDDVLLGEVNCGYGVFVHPEGTWSQTGTYPVVKGDTIYVRAYNLPKPEWNSSSMTLRRFTIRNNQGEIVSATLTRDDIPLTFYFDNLHMDVPEPGSLILVSSGLAAWALRRKRRRLKRSLTGGVILQNRTTEKGTRMRRAILTKLAAIGAVLALTTICEGATITWCNIHPEGPAPVRDSKGALVPGAVTFGEPVLSNGALVQLWKAMNGQSPGGRTDIDNPCRPSNILGAHQSTSWKIDDILLDMVNCGYGTLVDPEGTWSQTGNYPVTTGDTIYVRAYNIPKPNWYSTSILSREVGISNDKGRIVSATLTRDDIPLTFYFDNLRTGCIPEPGTFAWAGPGIGLWLLRTRKRRRDLRSPSSGKS